MASKANRHFIHVTSLALGQGGAYIVARCELCNIVAEREVKDANAEAIANLLGAEALARRGCEHVGSVVGFGSGVRRARTRPR